MLLMRRGRESFRIVRCGNHELEIALKVFFQGPETLGSIKLIFVYCHGRGDWIGPDRVGSDLIGSDRTTKSMLDA